MLRDTEHHHKRARRFNTPGHTHFLTFSCHRRMPLLLEPACCELLCVAVRNALEQHAFVLLAYVFMPEHVHLLVRPRGMAYDISHFLKTVKQSSSKRIIHRMRLDRPAILATLRVRERPGKWCYRFWLEGGGYDENILNREKAVEKAKYCHRNPVARGLVRHPRDWRWCSYRWLAEGRREAEPLEIDAWS